MATESEAPCVPKVNSFWRSKHDGPRSLRLASIRDCPVYGKAFSLYFLDEENYCCYSSINCSLERFYEEFEPINSPANSALYAIGVKQREPIYWRELMSATLKEEAANPDQ